jgi:transposase
MSDRQQRGLALAALYRIEQQDGKWLVPSQTGDGTKYTVDPDPEHPHCTCPDHVDRGVKCKHMFAVEFVQTRERVVSADGSETVTVTNTFKVTERVTYKQNWPAYNAAQTTEKRRFLAILGDLCAGVPEPPRSKMGRPPVPLADLVFSIVFKVYSTVSVRRFTCDLQDAAEKGYIRKAPHYNKVCDALEDAALTPILKRLIVESSKPLAAVETDFAADSSGFSTCRFERWFDIKYAKTVTERQWVKVHIMTGITTNVVSAVEILGKTAHDAPLLPPLLKTTAETFDIAEVSADAGYSSGDNMQAIVDVGAKPYIAFKDNATGGVGGIFAKMFHYYSFNKDEYLEHYHKRSNVESTFSMVKAKFGDSLRSKSDAAMVNESLCKILCHNVCCLIQSAYELGIEPLFWGEGEQEEAAEVGPESASVDGEAEMWAWV